MARRRVKPIESIPFVGGAVCLDFVNTTGARASDQPRERLGRYADLLVFYRRVKLLSTSETSSLKRQAECDPKMASSVLEQVVRVREVLYRLLCAVATGAKPARADFDQFNAELSLALGHRRFVWARGKPSWSWAYDPSVLERRLGPILHSAAVLLESSERTRLRKCGDCDWLFLDTTRNHSRRWCKKDCGDRVKARRYYHRHKDSV